MNAAGAPTPVDAPATTFPQAVWLVAERELGAKLRSKAFLISSAILLLVVLGGVIWGGIAANQGESKTPVAATAEAAAAIDHAKGLEVTEVADRAEAEALVTDGEVDAAIVMNDDSPVGLTVLASSETPSGVVTALSQQPNVELLDPNAVNPAMRYFAAIGFGLVFMMAAMMFGTTIAQSVVEEKQTRVVEILISTISTRALLTGKVVGNTILAMAQILALTAVMVVGLVVTGQTELLRGLGTPLVWFAVFFLFGFVLIASLFAATGAMVSRQEDIGSTTTPVMWLVMLPYFLVILFNDNPLVLGIMSYVPFSAPVGMPMRLFLGDAQWWEPVASLVVTLATCVAVIALGAKIYENSLLRMGGRVKLAEALKA